MEPTELSARILQNAVGTLELYTIYLGERLGYYRTLAADGPLTSSELAARTGTAERYAREWLAHQAAAGLVEVVEPGRCLLPAGHVPVLADASSLLFGTSMSIQLVRAARALGDVVDAFRTGGAPAPMAWEPEGRQPSNRAAFLNLLGQEWLPAIPSVHKRLSAGARVADVACGLGWSSIGMALAYPEITVHGLDLDTQAIAAATVNAVESADRVDTVAEPHVLSSSLPTKRRASMSACASAACASGYIRPMTGVNRPFAASSSTCRTRRGVSAQNSGNCDMPTTLSRRRSAAPTSVSGPPAMP